MSNDRRRDPSLEPRFVDAHVHIQDVRGLADLSAAGIAVARDAGTREGTGLAAATSPRQPGTPLIISAGKALYKKGGYGSALGIPLAGIGDIRREIVVLRKSGAGIIKAMASGLVSLARKDTVTPGGFSGEELFALVREADAEGLSVMAHANGEDAIIAAAEAGVRSIEHGFFMTPRALEVMAKHRTFWTPTAGALARAAEAGAASREMKDHIRHLILDHLRMIGLAHAVGVSLAVGTDCVLPEPAYKAAYDAELGYFEQAGLSHDEVMRIACEDGERLLGM